MTPTAWQIADRVRHAISTAVWFGFCRFMRSKSLRPLYSPSMMENSASRYEPVPAEFGFISDAVIMHGYQAVGTASKGTVGDRKSTRLNSSHQKISYAVF